MFSTDPILTTRAVLVVSGFNEFVESFINLSIQPVGIVQLSQTKYNTSWLNRGKQCKTYCLKHGLQYANLSYANIPTLAQVFERWEAELVITYSVPILPMYVLDNVSLGGVNVHHSYLPAYRGGNPLLWQVMDENESFGITVHVLAEQVDQGGILAQVEIPRVSGISKQKMVADSNRTIGVPLLHQAICEYVQGDLTPVPQPIHSTTQSANHVLPQEFLLVLARKNVSLTGLWDVACFYSNLPVGCLAKQGWRSWFQWVPVAVLRGCKGEGCNLVDEHYQLIPAGLELHLTHTDGCVVFKPRWHANTFLFRLLL